MKTTTVCGIFAAGLMVLAGCQLMEPPLPAAQEPVKVAPAAAPAGSAALERRFTDGPSASDAVQSALLWSEKYQQLSETTNQIREKNMQLFEENTQLKKEVESLQGRLAKTQKELDEASEFLQKMHVELNQWKADVLGFREELRKAQASQLQALGKILRILGAEAVEPEASTPAPAK
jgi:regulator of replication initiation timing